MNPKKLNPKYTTFTAQLVKQQRAQNAEEKLRKKSLSEAEKIQESLDAFINEAMYKLIGDPESVVTVETAYPFGRSRDRSLVDKSSKFYEENKTSFQQFGLRMAEKYGLKNVYIAFDFSGHHITDDMCQSGDGYYYYPIINFIAELDL